MMNDDEDEGGSSGAGGEAKERGGSGGNNAGAANVAMAGGMTSAATGGQASAGPAAAGTAKESGNGGGRESGANNDAAGDGSGASGGQSGEASGAAGQAGGGGTAAAGGGGNAAAGATGAGGASGGGLGGASLSSPGGSGGGSSGGGANGGGREAGGGREDRDGGGGSEGSGDGGGGGSSEGEASSGEGEAPAEGEGSGSASESSGGAREQSAAQEAANAASPVCFLEGTLIETAGGPVAVEHLVPGEAVKLHGGGTAPVRWIGRQTVATRFCDPLRAHPIRIRAGALGEGVPARDLLVSPDHAIFVGDILAHASALVNGVSITRESGVPERLRYFHVELPAHALLLAEGTAAESFVDNPEHLAFDNAAERAALSDPAPTTEMPLPRAKSARQVPPAIRRALDVRAAMILPRDEAA